MIDIYIINYVKGINAIISVLYWLRRSELNTSKWQMIQTVLVSRFIYDWNVFQYRLRHLTSLLTSNNCLLCRLTSDIEHSAMWDFPLLENLSGTCPTFGPSYWFSLTSQHHNHTMDSFRTDNKNYVVNYYYIKHFVD